MAPVQWPMAVAKSTGRWRIGDLTGADAVQRLPQRPRRAVRDARERLRAGAALGHCHDVWQPLVRGHLPRLQSAAVVSAVGDSRTDVRFFIPGTNGATGATNFSFFGAIFPDARIGRVLITAGDYAGPDETANRAIVMMDDFIYSEPRPR